MLFWICCGFPILFILLWILIWKLREFCFGCLLGGIAGFSVSIIFIHFYLEWIGVNRQEVLIKIWAWEYYIKGLIAIIWDAVTNGIW